jgi:hypothetical protein
MDLGEPQLGFDDGQSQLRWNITDDPSQAWMKERSPGMTTTIPQKPSGVHVVMVSNTSLPAVLFNNWQYWIQISWVHTFHDSSIPIETKHNLLHSILCNDKPASAHKSLCGLSQLFKGHFHRVGLSFKTSLGVTNIGDFSRSIFTIIFNPSILSA